MTMQINIQTKVNSATIRTENYNGRDHIVLPSYTLPANVVMNGGLYPASEIDAHYLELEGTLAPMGHPMKDGKYVSAYDPESINAYHAGAWNRNVKKSGNRVYMEKWVDVETAKSTAQGRELLERVAAIARGDDVPPIHTSVAAFVDQEPAEQGAGYDWIAKIHGFDHDAILLHEPGAATPEQGVGLMVNADQAQPVVVNSGVLAGESYGDKRQRLEEAVTAAFVQDPDKDYAWVADFTDSQAIIVRNGGNAEVFGYKMESGKIVLDNSGTPVHRKETWVMKFNQAMSKLLGFSAPNTLKKEETQMAFTAEDQATITSIVANAVATAIKPVADDMAATRTELAGVQAAITANARAAEATQRAAVAAKFGDVVANSLQGDALEAMFKQCGDAADLQGNNKQPDTPADDGLGAVLA